MKSSLLKASLKPYNTFGIEAYASAIIEWKSEDEVREFFKNGDCDVLVLGGGSNVLFTRDIEKTVVLNRIKGIEVMEETDDRVKLRVGAGEDWHEFVLYCIEKDWGGIENLSLIPGCVGASPIQNIGAYGVEVKDVIVSVEAINRINGNKVVFNNAQCMFGYRDSIFKTSHKDQYIITAVVFRLEKSGKVNVSYGAIQAELEKMGVVDPAIRDVSNAVIRIRQSKLPDPKFLGNAGSFFKNPVVSTQKIQNLKKDYPQIPYYPVDDQHAKVPAGWLIETAGWKGKRFENCGVHEKQALVIVNYGGARGEDIYQLSERILQDIADRYGITLEREVNIIK